jgi:hypothetical protein
MSNIPSSERSLIGQIAANTRWSTVQNRSAATAPARKAFEKSFDQLVDPEGVLTPSERAKLVENARRAHFQKLALKSAQSRRRAKDARAQANRLDLEADQAESAIEAGASPPTPSPQPGFCVTTPPSENARKAVVDERIAELDGGGDHAA